MTIENYKILLSESDFSEPVKHHFVTHVKSLVQSSRITCSIVAGNRLVRSLKGQGASILYDFLDCLEALPGSLQRLDMHYDNFDKCWHISSLSTITK